MKQRYPFYWITGMIVLGSSFCSPASASETASVRFPLTMSEDGNTFVDQDQQTFFYVADYSLEILAKLTLEETEFYLETRRQQGFTVLQAFATPPAAEMTNAEGFPGFDPIGDITSPVDGWWDHVAAVCEIAEKKGMAVNLMSLFFGCCAQYAHYWTPNLNEENAFQYGHFLGTRFRDHKNVLWLHGGDQQPGEWLPLVRAMAQGIREAGNSGLQSYLSTGYNLQDYGATARTLDREAWMDYHTLYHYSGCFYPEMLVSKWIAPEKPLIAAWLAYENQSPGGEPRIIRQQAWLPFLTGGCGTTFLQGQMWWFTGVDWRSLLHSPGATYTSIAAEALRHLPWNTLQPDDQEKLVIEGIGSFGTYDYANTAISSNHSLAIIYVPTKRTLGIDRNVLARGDISATWIDPTNGKSIKAGTLLHEESHADRAELLKLSSPGENSQHDEDWVLILSILP